MGKILDVFLLLLCSSVLVAAFYVIPKKKENDFNNGLKDIKIGTKSKVVSGFYEGCEAQFVAWTKDDAEKIAYHIMVVCALEDYSRHVPMKLSQQEAKQLKQKGLLE